MHGRFYPDQQWQRCWGADALGTLLLVALHRDSCTGAMATDGSHLGLDNQGPHRDSLTQYATNLKDKLQVADGLSPRWPGGTQHRKQDRSLQSRHLLFWPAQKPLILLAGITLHSSLREPHLSHSQSV